MESGIGKVMESVGSFFGSGDTLPWCDRDIIAGFEREVMEAGSQEQKSESHLRLSWALVHSKLPEDVNRGIGMLEASLENPGGTLQTRERLYLLAVGYYRRGDYAKSRQLVERCLEVAPDWRQGLTLRKVLEDKIAKDGVIGMGIVAGSFGLVGLLIGGIVAAASSSRKK